MELAQVSLQNALCGIAGLVVSGVAIVVVRNWGAG
jgi:hypothetical protein